MFCALLGTMAGNLVLTLGAVGGAYIGGGIVPQLGQLFTSSPFRDRFEDKGRYADYLSRVPTYRHPRGAARVPRSWPARSPSRAAPGSGLTRPVTGTLIAAQ